MEAQAILQQFKWRFLLIRIVVNAFALAGTAAFLPKIYFVEKSLGNWLLMAFMLGILNAILKPILQFLTLQFIFITYGLVVVFVNALLLWLLAFIFPNRFAAENILWILVGGLILGLFGSFLENLLGLSMPIVSDEPPELRLQVEEKARQVEWLTSVNQEVATMENILANEAPLSDSNSTQSSQHEPKKKQSTSLNAKSGPADSEGGLHFGDTTSTGSPVQAPRPDEDHKEDPS